MLALTLLFLAGTPPPTASAAKLSVPFERYTLPNGLTVILHEDHTLPLVTVNLWFGVGSADERPGRTGFAHLFEHLMFMGTRAVPNGAFDSLMEQEGGTNNASTSNDRTNYFEMGPSNLLETFLFLEADRLAHLADDMTKEKVDLQRDVVKNERRQSYENRPYGMLGVLLYEKMFPANHPYHHPVIGSHADLTAASVDDVKAFFRTWYVPANGTLVVAGDFKPAEARQLVAKYLGALPRVEAPLRVLPPVAELAKPVRVVQPDDVKQERVVLAWHSPAAWRRGDTELQLLAALLGDGKSSRLVKSLVLEQQLADSVSVSQDPMTGAGLFLIVATAQGAHTAAELEKAIDAELAKLKASPPTADELSRARALLQTEYLSALEGLFARADALNEMEWAFGDPGQLERSALNRFDAVSESDVAEWANRTLGKPRLSLSFVPKKQVVKGGKR